MGTEAKRIEYERHTLSENDVLGNPSDQLKIWWDEAIRQNIPIWDAVHLSTVDENRRPDARIVLLKSFDEQGLVFYTNYQSTKAKQLAKNNCACLLIFWPQLERQIRIRGSVEKTSREESQDYFATRPKGAKIGAWASPQSTIIKDRDELEKAYAELEHRFSNSDVPCPDHWGGFRLKPDYFEFWQGRQNRLHDRLSYSKTENSWAIKRLAP